MKPLLSIVPELYPEQGGAPASVIMEAKRVDSVNDIELLFREAIQNSNDQRNSRLMPLTVTLGLRKISKAQAEFLGACIKSSGAERTGKKFRSLNNLDARLRRSDARYIFTFADSGTKGLNGPLSASESAKDKNFVNFFFKIGKDSNADPEAGGSKGEGRGVFFINSDVGTAFAYSRFKANGGSTITSRFFGMTLGDSFSLGGKEYTGRWFWGKRALKGRCLPYQGAEADSLGKIFGMDHHLKGVTGTVIGVLLPKFVTNDSDAEKYCRYLQYAAEKIIWPHLVKVGDKAPSIRLEIVGPHGEIYLPNVLSKSSPVAKYATLYAEHLGQKTKEGTVNVKASLACSFEKDGLVHSLRKDESLGILKWRCGLVAQKSDPFPSQPETPTGIEEGPHVLTGIAFFRLPKLVVQYYETGWMGSELEVYGFFESSKKANTFFREAEAGSHDEWLWRKLQLSLGKSRPNPVRRLQTVIGETVQGIRQAEKIEGRQTLEIELMNEIGEILDFAGTGVRKAEKTVTIISPPPPPPPPTVLSPVSVSRAGEPRLISRDKTHVVGEFAFSLLTDCSLFRGRKYRVFFIPIVVTREGIQSVTAADDSRDPVVSDVYCDGGKLDGGHLILQEQDGDSVRRLKVRLKIPADLMTDCRAKVELWEPAPQDVIQ